MKNRILTPVAFTFTLTLSLTFAFTTPVRAGLCDQTPYDCICTAGSCGVSYCCEWGCWSYCSLNNCVGGCYSRPNGPDEQYGPADPRAQVSTDLRFKGTPRQFAEALTNLFREEMIVERAPGPQEFQFEFQSHGGDQKQLLQILTGLRSVRVIPRKNLVEANP